MSILDDAIREHLELKRAHGADDAELKKLEDEAFGPPERPDAAHDPFAEAPTEFMTHEGEPSPEAADAAEASRSRRPDIADLQEAPPTREQAGDEPAAAEASEPEPAVEEPTAMEHQAIPDAQPETPAEPELAADPDSAPEPSQEIDSGPNTEERHAIAEQPTEMFDVQGDISASGPADAPPAEEPPDYADEDEDDFFSDQRLSEELHKALEAPLDEPSPFDDPASSQPFPSAPVPHTEEAAAVVESEEARTDTADFDQPELGDEPADEPAAAPPAAPEDDEDAPPELRPVDQAHEDLLEDTPEFLEDAPEDDNLWFEQKPPKDFDFDD